MPARKAAKKGAAKKSTAKARKGGITAARGKLLTRNIIQAIIDRRQWVMYAQPIWDVIATGNLAEMRKTATITRKHIADVQRSLGQLETRIRSPK
jgi:hypothetical protein